MKKDSYLKDLEKWQREQYTENYSNMPHSSMRHGRKISLGKKIFLILFILAAVSMLIFAIFSI